MYTLNEIIGSLTKFIGNLWQFIFQMCMSLAPVLFIPGLTFILLFVTVVIWFERKYLAHAMLRMGPVYAGRVFGWLQCIADFLKILTKEIIVPSDADKTLYYLAPILLPIVDGLAIAFIPVAPDWVIFRGFGYGLPLFLAIVSLGPLCPLIAGWAANNKYTVIGSLRAAYMCIAAEIPLLLSAAGIAILAGSFDLVDIVEAQSKMWFIIPGFLGALVFFIGILAEAERTPFDISVAEQEIVFGWRTEYSGILFMLTMMAEYISLLAWELLFITLFLGGYKGPVIFGSPFISNIAWVLIKLGILTAIIILLRTVFPRFRLDQAIKIGWRYLIPLAIANIYIAIIIKLFFPFVV
ncbi:MAG: NADH-quinone oxidoreductase subunit NuoH [Candidatus Baldrarchaeia archaeon]